MASNPTLPSKDHVWTLEKYARFIPLSTQRSSLAAGSSQAGTWKHFDESDLRGGDLRLSIFEGGHLLLGVQKEVFENFLLWNAHKWLRIAAKGDSMLCVYENAGQASRRFRVRFRAGEGKSAEENCAECSAVLSHYTQVRDLNPTEDSAGATESQPEGEQRGAAASSAEAMDVDSSATPSSKTIAEIAKRYIKPPSEDTLPLGIAYQTTGFPTAQLPALVQLCLTDSNFPAFVEAVDKELTKLVS